MEQAIVCIIFFFLLSFFFQCLTVYVINSLQVHYLHLLTMINGHRVLLLVRHQRCEAMFFFCSTSAAIQDSCQDQLYMQLKCFSSPNLENLWDKCFFHMTCNAQLLYPSRAHTGQVDVSMQSPSVSVECQTDMAPDLLIPQ